MTKTLWTLAVAGALVGAGLWAPASEATGPIVVFEDDFEGASRSEWSTSATFTVSDGTQGCTSTRFCGTHILGKLGREDAYLNLTGLPAHASATVAFDLFILDSWDGNRDADVVKVLADSVTLLDASFSNIDGDFGGFFIAQSYPDPCCAASHPAGTGALEIDTLGSCCTFGGNTVYRFALDFAHAATSLELLFRGLPNEALSNEAWGLDNVVVTLHAPPNEAPVADAGPDQTVDEGVLVALTGSGTDPDADALTFAWTQLAGPAVSLSDAASATPTFTAPLVAADVALAFELAVSDGEATATDTVQVTVRDVASPPPPDTGFCPRGHGYWKNHPGSWPVETLALGGATFTKAQAIDTLKTPAQGDARLILAYALVAAKLNLAAGATDAETPDGLVSELVADADAALAADGGALFARADKVPTSSAAGQAMLALKDALAPFNEDLLTPGC